MKSIPAAVCVSWAEVPALPAVSIGWNYVQIVSENNEHT